MFRTTALWPALSRSAVALPSRSVMASNFRRSTWPTLPSILSTPICLRLFAPYCVSNNEHFVFRDNELAYWLLMYNPKMHWNADLPLQDAMRARWAYNYESQIKTLNLGLLDARAHGLFNDAYANADARANVPVVMPFFDEVLRAIISPSTTTADAISMVSSAILDPAKMGDLVHGMFTSFSKDVLVDPLKWVVRELLWAANRAPRRQKVVFAVHGLMEGTNQVTLRFGTSTSIPLPWARTRAGIGPTLSSTSYLT